MFPVLPDDVELVEEAEVTDPNKPLLSYLMSPALPGDVVMLQYDRQTGRRILRLVREKKGET